jgi:hypothetical protein
VFSDDYEFWDGNSFAATDRSRPELAIRRTKSAHADVGRVSNHDECVKVRITRKFADFIDGVDLSAKRVGDVIEVPSRDAKLLVAENWAVNVSNGEPLRVEAADPPRRNGEYRSPRCG